MSRFWRSSPAFGLAFALIAVSAGTPAAAGESRHAAFVVDANTGRVLHERNADALRHPASLTKMMTLYLAFEAIEAGRLSYVSRVPVSANAAAAAPSKLDLEPGEDIALSDAIKALITKSANDMAIAVAEKIAGSEEAFVRLMNARARDLGMRSTTFRNPSGLPDAAQVTTARDMLTLALRLEDDFPQHCRLFSIRSFTFRGKTYRTHNTLMNSFAGIDGIKTGYTRASGFNLVSSLRRDGKHIVAAVFGGVTASARNAHMRSLLFHALDDASREKTRNTRPMLVASARPAIRPAAKPATEARPVWMADDPAPAEKRVAAAPQRPAEVSNQTVAQAPRPAPAAPATPADAEPTITIAKVRAVKVLPEASSRAPEARRDASETPATDASAGAESTVAFDRLAKAPLMSAATAGAFDFRAFRAALRAEREAAPAAADPAGDTETVQRKSTASITPLAPLEPGLEAVAPAEVALHDPTPAAAPAPASERASLEPAAAVTSGAPGRPASTLAAQAAALDVPAARNDAAVQRTAMHLNGPQPSRSAGGYAIQIGAYATAAEAERRLAETQGRTGHLLDGRPAVAVPAQSGARAIYRARFAGFAQAEASTACLELRRQAIDCFVARAD